MLDLAPENSLKVKNWEKWRCSGLLKRSCVPTFGNFTPMHENIKKIVYSDHDKDHRSDSDANTYLLGVKNAVRSHYNVSFDGLWTGVEVKDKVKWLGWFTLGASVDVLWDFSSMCDVYLCVSGCAARVIEPTLRYRPLLENLNAPLILCKQLYNCSAADDK